MANLIFTRWYPGYYKTNITDKIFANIKKNGKEWHAEIRSTASGNVIQFAGIWKTLKDAKEEVCWVARNYI